MQEEEKNWISEVLKERQKILDWIIRDRLSSLSKLMFMNSTVASSITGWNAWFTNPLIMDKFSVKELKELCKEFEKIVVAFLDLDVKYTEVLKKQVEEEKITEDAKLEEIKETTKKKISYMV